MKKSVMGKNRKRIINFRFFLFVAVCMIISIFFAWIYFSVALLSILLIASFSIFLICSFIKYFRSHRDTIKSIAMITAFILSIIVYSIYIYEVINWLPSDFVSGMIYRVEGTVDGNTVRNGNRLIVLDNLKLSGDSVKGKLRVYFSEEQGGMEFAREGDILIFSAKVTGTKIESNYRKNQRYYASVSQSDIILTLGNPSFLQKIRAKMYKTLSDNLSDDYSAISYSMLTGDKDDLPLNIADYFRASGLAHILAVSGLHIGFMIMILFFPLKKLKINKWISFGIITAGLLAYIFIADFSPSVIRASVMGIVGLIASIRGRQRDLLNNLSCSVCILLIGKPNYLFDIGFLMSVCAVLGIILFAPPIRKALTKLKFPRFLSSSIATTLSAQISVLPLTIYYFKSVSLYSMISNILLIYIIMLTFILLITGVILTIFIPVMGFVIRISGYGLLVIDNIAQLVAKLPFARLIVFSLLPIFLCYLIYFMASRFVRKPYFSRVISAVCMFVCVVIAVFCNYSYNISDSIIPVTTAYYDVTSVVTVGDKIYIIGDMQSSYDVMTTLNAIRAKKVDAIFINKLNEKTARQLIEIEYNYKGFTVYFPLSVNMTGLDILLSKIEIRGFEESGEVENKIFAEFYSGKFLCYRLDNEISALFFSISTDFNKLSEAQLENVDIVRSHSYSSSNELCLINSFEDLTEYLDSIITMSESEYTIYSYKTKKTKVVKFS